MGNINPSKHRKSGQHSKGASHTRLTDEHYDNLYNRTKKLEEELLDKRSVE